MYLFVGLGNPGREYENTRHNVGFRILDKIAEQCDCTFKPGKGSYWFAECSLKNTNVYLLKPTTYMNLSGIAVKEFLDVFPVKLDSLVIILDDIQLPLGSLRFRLRGSDGGHNGLASVIFSLGTENFPRLRVGIAPLENTVPSDRLAEFVLSPFEKSEEPIIHLLIEKGANALLDFVERGSTFVMNTYNKSFL